MSRRKQQMQQQYAYEGGEEEEDDDEDAEFSPSEEQASHQHQAQYALQLQHQQYAFQQAQVQQGYYHPHPHQHQLQHHHISFQPAQQYLHNPPPQHMQQMAYVQHDVYVSDQARQAEIVRQLAASGTGGKTNPQTVAWLMENYEPADGVSLPRGTLYAHYLDYCNGTTIEPINAASFGKLIRQVFPNLKTRRLGTRGNSKYHYYGIRVRPDSRINNYTVVEEPEGTQYVESGDGRGHHSAPHHQEAATDDLEQIRPEDHGINTKTKLPDFPRLSADITLNKPESDVFEPFMRGYHTNGQLMLESVANLNFHEVSRICSDFWKQGFGAHCGALMSVPGMALYLQQCDNMIYDVILTTLMPDVLHPLPMPLTQAIRHFAKTLESILRQATENQPADIVTAKIEAAQEFCQALRRYTSLNHLAQAARAVLQNQEQSLMMVQDLMRVDFNNVREQAMWVCRCDDQILKHFEQEFKDYLQQQKSIEEWAVWLQKVFDICLEGATDLDREKRSRNFLLSWSFYGSLVIRDLTLRSATSFGSFHLMRLLLDEYMFFLVEQQAAKGPQRRQRLIQRLQNQNSGDSAKSRSKRRRQFPPEGEPAEDAEENGDSPGVSKKHVASGSSLANILS